MARTKTTKRKTQVVKEAPVIDKPVVEPAEEPQTAIEVKEPEWGKAVYFKREPEVGVITTEIKRVFVPDPKPDQIKHRIVDERSKGKMLSFVYLHPDNGKYSFEYLVPFIGQQPYYFRNHYGLLNQFDWLLVHKRRRLYVYREIKKYETCAVKEKSITVPCYYITPYEPDALIENDLTPEEGNDATDWSCISKHWAAVLKGNWRSLIEEGIIYLSIIIVGVLIWFTMGQK